MKKQHANKGFTIVELLVVIVVIAILVAISIVAYIGMQNKAGISVLTSDLKNASTRLALDNAANDGYPDSEVDANGGKGLPKSLDTTYQYTKTGNSYCLSATSAKYKLSFHISSDSGGVVEEGVCSGHVAVGSGGEAVGWTQMSIGWEHACGIHTNGNVYCWGSSTVNGQNQTESTPKPIDTSGVLSGKTVKAISSGYWYTCVIASDNKVYCWGSNSYGQLGNGSITNSRTPVAVDTSGLLNNKTIVSISAGVYQACAIDSDGKAYCWGLNSSGQLGNGSTTDSSVPVAVDMSGALYNKTIKSISKGRYSTCVIASDDNGYCWGNNYAGQLGSSGPSPTLSPTAINTSGALYNKTIKSITASDSNTCVIASDDNAYCWGGNYSGQLGINNSTGSYTTSSPTAVNINGALKDKPLRKIDSMRETACAIAYDNKVYCWGKGNNGQFGRTVANYVNTVPVATDDANTLNNQAVKDISVGPYTICLITESGKAYCAGGLEDYATPGILGNGSPSGSLFFLPVSPIPELMPPPTPRTTITLSSQELYVGYPGDSQTACKEWTAPTGKQIVGFKLSQATEANYDYFTVSLDNLERFRASGTYTDQYIDTTSLPGTTLKACMSADGSVQSGFGGEVTSVDYN